MILEKIMDFLWERYEKLVFLTAIIFALSLIALILNFARTGEVVKLGIDFKGGTEVLIGSPEQLDKIGGVFSKAYGDVRVREISGEKRFVIIDFVGSARIEEVEKILKDENIFYSDVSVRSLAPVVSQGFFKEAIIAVLFAFVLMGSVIFLSFRRVVPSMAAILSVVFDVGVTMAIMNLLGIELNLGSLAALLMLIGYSVDTDILLTTKILRLGVKKENFLEAMRTGLTFSSTAIAAFFALMLISNSPVLDSIASVVFIGLIADIPSTWIQNSALLKIFLKNEVG